MYSGPALSYVLLFLSEVCNCRGAFLPTGVVVYEGCKLPKRFCLEEAALTAAETWVEESRADFEGGSDRISEPSSCGEFLSEKLCSLSSRFLIASARSSFSLRITSLSGP